MDASSSTPWKDRIRQERIRHNWRQQDLADQLGTTVVTIQRWERGTQQPSTYFRAKLCALFDKSVEELGLLPEAGLPDGESGLSAVATTSAIDDRSSAEEVPGTVEVDHAASLTMALPSTSSPPHEQPTRSPFLTRRRLLVGLAGGTLVSIAGGMLVFLRSSPSEFTAGKTLFIYHGHSAPVRAVVWSPRVQSQRIASAGDDGTVQVWTPRESADRAGLIYRQHHSAVSAVAWSPDGQWIASAGLDVHVWSAFSGQRRWLYRAHTAKVNAVAWSPDGRNLASGGDDHTVQVWDALNGKLHAKLEHQAEVTGVSWSPDGRHLASSSADHEVRVWDTYTETSLQTYTGHTRVEAVAWSPDERYLASSGDDRTLQIWKPLKGTTCWRSPQPRMVWAVAWSPSSRQVAAADGGGTVQVLAVPGVRLQLSYTGHRHEVRAVAWSPEGTRIASGGQDRTVHVWQAR